MRQILLKSLVFLLFCSCFIPLHAEVTNTVDIAALIACETGETNGWSVTGLQSYAASRGGGVKLNTQSSLIKSPVFSAPVIRIDLRVRSSSPSGRRLAFMPLLADDDEKASPLFCTHSPNDDTYIRQTLAWDAAIGVRQFSIAREGETGTTVWGIAEMSVVTAGDPMDAPPADVRIEGVRSTSARIVWTNPDAPVISNRISLVRTERIPESGTILAEEDFATCVNTGSSTGNDRSSDLSNRCPGWSGSRIYYYPNTNGILQISTGSDKGVLVHRGLEDLSDVTVRIRAQGHPSDPLSRTLSVFQTEGGVTNVLGTIQLENAFATGSVPLSAGSPNLPLCFGNLDSVKSNRRILIDEIAFIRNYQSEHLDEQRLSDLIIPTNGHHLLRGLSPLTDYRAAVSAILSDGSESRPSETIRFTTVRASEALCISIR